MNTEYKSQYGQDKYIIENVFKCMNHGCFIDLGAHDGITFSNTYVLEKKYNWEGICVEPNTDIYQQLKNNRSCITSDLVVSTKQKEVDFFYIKDGDPNCPGCSMFSSTIPFKHPHGEVQKCKKLAFPLYSLLEFYNVPKMIHYMSLDIEGSEVEVLNKYFEDEYINNDIGWRRRIITISVEHNYNAEVRDSLNKILSKYHYTLIKENEIDDIYIHNIYKDIVT